MQEYQLIRSLRAKKRTSVRINESGQVEVRTPRWTPRWLVDRFVESQKQWIEKALEEFNSRTKRSFTHGEVFPFFDHRLPLEITASHERRRVNLKFLGDHFWASIPSGLPNHLARKQLSRLFINWYKRHCLEKLSALTQKYCIILGVKCNEIKIKNHRSRWGSCSSSGNISYNWRLGMAPLEIAEYVVIHEVCHLIHQHHRQTFWQLVETHCPKYQHHRKWLRQNRHSLELS